MNATHPFADPAVFVEQGEREAGLGDIWARMIAPEIPVEAQLRDTGRRVFHGLLVEIDLEPGLTGSITVRHCRNDDRSALPGTGNLTHVPGFPVVLKSDPMFHRRFDIFADDEASARALLGPRFRAALRHLADRWGATPWQAGHAWGKLMIAMPGEGDLFEPRSVATGTFDPAGDLRLLLEELSLPYRIIDTFAGIDPDTGRRLRA